ncbi:AMP-binding protein [Azohydromonas caseinilytica]|uniref:Long-chain-fatty-acid--CoA ligase n=1 Tax=Azohydromonas caseinilytica TaxID=2728836 RepID=A0A848FCC2_9BURK|nr:AMP-binding protein [Azohydromonas caseinilytica]NML17124.1 AMP-binding protein [Azohydromonas caseinilytica]
MDRIWLEHYPPGIPAQVDLGAFQTLKDLFEDSCRRFHDLPAFTNMGTSLTYGELERLSAQFGAFLQKRAGLGPGARVAIMLPNLLQYPVALFGTLRAGLTVVNVNPLYTARELRHQLHDSGAQAIVVLENFAHTLQEVLPDTAVQTVITTGLGDMLGLPKALLVNFVARHVKHMVPHWHIEGAFDWKQVMEQGAQQRLDAVPLQRDDLAFLQYTGGTTGVAKGAMLSHGNMVANLLQTSAWIGGVLREGVEIAVTPLPLYHVFSLTANALFFLKWGANNHLITNPRDTEGFIKEIKHLRFTAITGVNTLYNALLNAPSIGEVDAGALKLTVAGGMAVHRSVAQRWQETMGVPIIEGYGLTEASPIVCANPLDAKEFSGTVGLPLPSTDISIRSESGEELGLNEVGELCVRGPQVMKGYWNQPAETARALTPDGWLHTGDMALVNARGCVQIIDRKKDLIIVSGFKVYPNEVEEVAAMHPGVLEAGAIGVPDAHSGEVVKLFVVPKDPALTEAALLEHCRQHLTAYKVPRQVELRTATLPKTPIGKVLRRALRDEDAARRSAPTA